MHYNIFEKLAGVGSVLLPWQFDFIKLPDEHAKFENTETGKGDPVDDK